MVPPVTQTAVIGEVHIPENSNTPLVCNRLIKDWKHHRGTVQIHGDATGGARHADAEATNWELVRQYLTPHFDLQWMVARSNPQELDRVANMNARLLNVVGDVRFAVDETKAPNVVRDFEGVMVLEGGSGEIDKKRTPKLSHVSDACGYYAWQTFRVDRDSMRLQVF